MNNLSSYCGLVDAKIRASDKDLPAQNRANNTVISGYEEIEGAAFGIARLQSQYNLDPNKMFKEGIIETHLNLKHIKSEPSIRKFTSDDLYQIGKVGVNEGLENAGIHGYI